MRAQYLPTRFFWHLFLRSFLAHFCEVNFVPSASTQGRIPGGVAGLARGAEGATKGAMGGEGMRCCIACEQYRASEGQPPSRSWWLCAPLHTTTRFERSVPSVLTQRPTLFSAAPLILMSHPHSTNKGGGGGVGGTGGGGVGGGGEGDGGEVGSGGGEGGGGEGGGTGGGDDGEIV